MINRLVNISSPILFNRFHICTNNTSKILYPCHYTQNTKYHKSLLLTPKVVKIKSINKLIKFLCDQHLIVGLQSNIKLERSRMAVNRLSYENNVSRISCWSII